MWKLAVLTIVRYVSLDAPFWLVPLRPWIYSRNWSFIAWGAIPATAHLLAATLIQELPRKSRLALGILLPSHRIGVWALVSIGVGMGLAFASVCIELAPHDLRPRESLVPWAWRVAPTLFDIVMSGAVCEEIFFRGCCVSLFAELASACGLKRSSVTVAVAASTIWFVSEHAYLGIVGMVYVFACSVAFSVLFLSLGRSILPPMIAHVVSVVGMLVLCNVFGF